MPNEVKITDAMAEHLFAQLPQQIKDEENLSVASLKEMMQVVTDLTDEQRDAIKKILSDLVRSSDKTDGTSQHD